MVTEKDINDRISEQVAAYKEAYNNSKNVEGKDKESYLQQMKRCVYWINKFMAEKRKLREDIKK